jgi:hypothetical protein
MRGFSSFYYPICPDHAVQWIDCNAPSASDLFRDKSDKIAPYQNQILWYRRNRPTTDLMIQRFERNGLQTLWCTEPTTCPLTRFLCILEVVDSLCLNFATSVAQKQMILSSSRPTRNVYLDLEYLGNRR